LALHGDIQGERKIEREDIYRETQKKRGTRSFPFSVYPFISLREKGYKTVIQLASERERQK
jgi:hypothetical protein